MDEYCCGHVNRRRLLLVRCVIMLFVIIFSRFLLALWYRTTPTRIMTMDISYLFGQNLLGSVYLLLMSFCLFIMISFVHYQECMQTIYTFEIINMIKYRTILFPLTTKRQINYGFKMNLITDFVVKYGFKVLVSTQVFGHLLASVILYFDHEITIGSTISLLVWNVLTTIYSLFIYGFFINGFVLWFGSALYLKYKFEEINDKIKYYLISYPDIFLVMYAIKEHKYLQKLVGEMNQLFRVLIFVIYYMATFAFQLLIFMAHRKDSSLLGRFGAIVILIAIFSAVFYTNVMNTWISGSAHKPYSTLYSIINSRINIRSNEKLKIMSFIESLSGPVIGFYCYDLFPMTNYQLYKYLCVSAINYFLIMTLF